MKVLVAAAVFVLGVMATSVLCEDKYTTKYDNIDLDEIMNNDRLMKNYIDCCMERGKCTPDGHELKIHITDALQTGCDKCSHQQKVGVSKVLHHLAEKRKDWWNELQSKYDPNGAFKEKYGAFLAEEGV